MDHGRQVTQVLSCSHLVILAPRFALFSADTVVAGAFLIVSSIPTYTLESNRGSFLSAIGSFGTTTSSSLVLFCWLVLVLY